MHPPGVDDPGATAAPALRRWADLPGPRGLPLLGNALQLNRSRVHQQFEALAREYGPVYRLKVGSRRAVVVANHEWVAQTLRDRPDGFRRSSKLEEVGQEMGLERGLFAANGDAWQAQRRMVMAGFDPAHVKAYFPSLVRVTRRLHGRWLRAAHSGASIDLQSDLMRFTVDAICGLAFGADVNTLESDEGVIQRHLDQIFPALFRRTFAVFPYWRYLRLPRDRRLDRSVIEVNHAIRGFIAQARARMQADPALHAQPGNLLEAMIAAADLGDSGVDDHDVAGNVLTMLLAGEDTTANTLAWMIDLLWRNPGALADAQQEVRRQAGDLDAFTPQRMATLDFVEACAHETMRLKPVAPFNVVQALHDTRIGDLYLPEGAVVILLMRHDSVDPALVGEAGAFQPGRWLLDGGPGQAASAVKRISMPFGAGPRICPGRYLALLEMKMAMAMLLGQFEIDSVSTPDGREPRERMAFTMVPVGLRMRLRVRS